MAIKILCLSALGIILLLMINKAVDAYKIRRRIKEKYDRSI